MDISFYKSRITRQLSEYRHSARQYKEEKSALTEALLQSERANKAQAFVQLIAEKVQTTAHQQIASLVSRCLEAVFEEEAYTFHVEFERKRGKTEARLQFIRDGRVVDPLSEAGGGTVDVASFALRLTCLILSRPQKRRLLVADEPFRMLSEEYVPKMRKLLETLASELNIQMILVTHNRGLDLGRTILLS